MPPVDLLPSNASQDAVAEQQPLRLNSIAYTEFAGDDNEWALNNVCLSQVNLIVGKNAVGKTRVINVINGLAALISGYQQEVFVSGNYQAHFSRNVEKWEYELSIHNSQVAREELFLTKGEKKDNLMHRGAGNIGRILADDIDGKPVKIKFQADARQVAVVSKRDRLQHPFLEALHEWGSSVRLFRFGEEMSPRNLTLAVKGLQVEVDEKNTSHAVAMLQQGLQFDGFKMTVMADMQKLSYPVTNLEIRKTASFPMAGILPGEFVGISVKEEDLKCQTDQTSMSQGMFRTLSLIIQTTYYAMAKKGGCILIDDIGEGLDFERSCTLVDLIRAKARESNFQLIMSTNNRFIMNRVPLEEWCVLQRTGSHVRARNYFNSRPAFERFKMTGLNNFDLLATDFLDKVKVNG